MKDFKVILKTLEKEIIYLVISGCSLLSLLFSIYLFDNLLNKIFKDNMLFYVFAVVFLSIFFVLSFITLVISFMRFIKANSK